MSPQATILLVEDDSNDVLLIRRAFSKAKVAGDLQVVSDGDAAVAYFAGEGPYQDRVKHPLPALVLLDLKLPRRPGHELLAWLRAQPALRRIPVVVLTSSREKSDIDRAYDLGANSYLEKPVGFEALLDLVNSLGFYWLVLNEKPVVEVPDRPQRVMDASPHILLVDDNPDDRALVVRQLEQEFPGVRVTQAADEAAFTTALETGGFDLVITDYQLRWTDGLGVLRRVKESCPHRPHCPVIMFTGTGNEAVAVEAMKAGFEDYVIKAPQHYVRIRAAVRAAIGRANAMRKAVESLLRSEARYGVLFNAANDAIFVFVLTEDGLPGPFIEVNDRACELVGYAREELLALSPLDLEARGTAEDERAAVEQLRTRKRILVERIAVARGGRKIPVEVSAHLLEVDGHPTVIAIVRDVSERKRTEEALRASAERLTALSHRLLEVQEEERRRIARELHDQVGQILTAIGIRLQTARTHADSASQSALDECVALAAEGVGLVRDISLGLRPSLLDDLGLEAALRWYADREGRAAGLEIEFRSGLAGVRLPSEIETVCFRVVQEALTNVFRHAGAKRVSIELRREESDVVLSVTDDGAGFDVGEVQRGGPHGSSLGLIGMEERVTLAGGRLEIESRPSRGTVVRARFQLP